MGWYHSALLSCYHHLNRKKKLKKSIVMPDCDFVENEKKQPQIGDWVVCDYEHETGYLFPDFGR